MADVTVISEQVPLPLVLHDIANAEGVDAVVCVVRIDGAWSTTWGGDLSAASLSMAAMKLMHDVMHRNEDSTAPNRWRR